MFGSTVTFTTSPPPPPQLTGVGMTAGGQFQFTLNGPVGRNYVIQDSVDLVNWVNLETNAITAGGVNVYDFPVLSIKPQRFYRALPAN